MEENVTGVVFGRLLRFPESSITYAPAERLMPRQPRDDQAGQIYHALNRGNQRQTIFHKKQDFQAFERILAEGLAKYPVELFAYTLMPNHWHLVLRPAKDRQMGRLLRWVTGTHTLGYRTHYHNLGGGHLYQGRFKSFAIGDDSHFFTVCRYVERNPLRCESGRAGRCLAFRFPSSMEKRQE